MGDGLGRDGIGVAIAEYLIVHPCLLIEFIVILVGYALGYALGHLFALFKTTLYFYTTAKAQEMVAKQYTHIEKKRPR